MVALVLAALVRSAVGTQLDSLTVDEPWHITAGVEYVRTGDFRLNPEHPPLVKLVAGLAMPRSFTLREKSPLLDKGSERDFVEETFFYDNDFRLAQSRARLALWTLNGLLLGLVGTLIWYTLGAPWAIGTLAFLALEPTVTAHAPVVMTDLPVALTLTAAALIAGRVVVTWQWRWLAALGLTMGLSLATKHSALPGLAGIGLFCTLAALWQTWQHRAERGALRALTGRAGQLFAVALLAIAVLWGFYGFHFHAGPNGSDDFNREMSVKLGDLRIASWRDLLTALDRWAILPRSYLWGLADTVRAGVEGRGESGNLLWGTLVTGSPPWYTWPSYLVSKVPLALLALAGVGAVVLRRALTTPAERWVMGGAAAMAAAHLLALKGSLGTYAGVRHALPVIVTLGLLAGAAVTVAWRERSRLLRVTVGGLGCLALVMTARIPRLWEYHNELVGGTANAWQYFGNEGLDLGQRAFEIKSFSDSVIAPSGEPTYSSYWFGEEQARALNLTTTRRVKSLADTNHAGIYRGYFIYPADAQRPDSTSDWEPAEVFAGLTRVARYGFVEIWHGTQTRPRTRASALFNQIMEEVYQRESPAWPVIAMKLEEVLAATPFHVNAAIELGNTYLRLGRREDAISAYERPFAHLERRLLSTLVKEQLETQMARLRAGEPLNSITPIRNPDIE